MSPNNSKQCRQQAGMSIVEMMVGIAVGMLVALAAAGTMQAFTASQRAGMAVGGSAMNSSTAIAALKHDLGAAGLGFFGDGKPLCDKMNLSLGAMLVLDNKPFSPVTVSRPSGSNQDKLTLAYGTEVVAGATVYVDGTSDGSAAYLKSYLPASAPQAVVMAASSPLPLCQLRTVTSLVPSTATSAQQLLFAPDGRHNDNTVAFTTPFTTEDGGQVSLLGAMVMNEYSVVNGDFKVSRIDGSESVLVRDVVAFRVQYGVSSAPDVPTLSSWVSGADFGYPSRATLTKIRAVRIGLVTRSTQREKAGADDKCDATLQRPKVFGVDIPESDLPADWACYRFRVATATIPMRNIAFGAPVGQTAGSAK